MNKPVVIVDYGMGNIHSVRKQFTRIGADVVVSSDANEILSAGRLVLPGVGHFTKAMENLDERGLIGSLNDAVLGQGTPILGICLGMQIMANYGEEGESKGLGWFDAEIRHFQVEDKLRFKVPHMGWNQAFQRKDSALFSGIPEQSEFYFVHSYHWIANEPGDVLTETSYTYEFVSAVEKGNIFGVQYHPEKSHGVGAHLLKNFMEL